jgi:arginine-tRNA-protein transferase
METLLTFLSPPDQCGYLPDRDWQLRYEVAASLTSAEYQMRLQAGWRRFGFALFRPECPSCQACRSLRVDVSRFRRDRSQKRAWLRNAHEVRITVGPPAVSPDKLQLYDRYHAFQAQTKGWPIRDPENPIDYIESFVENPFPTQEWCYYLADRLIAVGYVDQLPKGLSAIYFYYDPNERNRSLGTFNVLSIIQAAADQNLPYVYLGFYVHGCRSLEYKARFRPNEVLHPDGQWREFVT